MWKGKPGGYDMNLYRSDRQRWVAGVCGGIAENMGWPVGMVRLIAVTLFVITGSFAVLAYILAIFLLDRRDKVVDEYDSYRRDHGKGPKPSGLKDKVFNYQQSAGGQVKELSGRLKELDSRLQNMESYVTSKKYQFDQELRRS
ncbi:PspC domain-containing protein [Oceanospirillum beijerinckii]|uniref:PspC domain-containing protein n=1 Tax=Oceanospirillum beijerinckii TaxID=64976 RepID=UPI000428DF23|nr:PspC domain-containing protein [Oceanospirillum beijerinckii]MAC47050.1 PspC domain-containing protein [Oceanospirillum sp.]